jgi:seryl-tRNA synthetase
MLDPRFVSEHLEQVRAAIGRRGPKHTETHDRVAELARARPAVVTEAEAARAQRNDASASMAKLDKKSAEFTSRREELRALGDRIKELETKEKAVEAELEDAVLFLPNMPHESVPDGTSEADNRVVRVWGEKPALSFTPKDHADLGEALGILDFARGAKVSGARFTVLLGAAARLERALLMLMMDLHSSAHGYTEMWPPALVLRSAMRGTGQLPKFAAEMFRTERTKLAADAPEGEVEANELWLAPTAEVPVTNFHGDEIFEPGELPRAYAAYTACFRAEAGSYGKDTRGLIRQHQFDKVELVRFCEADGQGLEELEKLRGHAEKVLEVLGLHYRTVELCAADLGNGAKKCYDLEVWLPGQDAYREISSCSWFGDYQARRAKVRYRTEPKGKPRLVHTLNGSGLAIGRTLVAILEQYQQADGSVLVPKALWPYTHGLERIVPRSA